MNSIVVGGYKSEDVVNPIKGYQKPFVVTALIPNHKDGHYVKPNIIAFKYPNFKKDVDRDVHVKMFNFVVKENVETFEECVINTFSYTFRNTTLDLCHNYTLKFLDYIFSKLTHAFCKRHWKIQNDEQIYMELKNTK
jgi:hypothetical protein